MNINMQVQMKRGIARRFQSLAVWMNRTPISEIPGVKSGYQIIRSRLLPKEPTWMAHAGYDLLVDLRTAPGREFYLMEKYEPEIQSLIESEVNSGDIVLDVGSLYGYHTLKFRQQVGPDGEVYAIEPEPKNADFIRRTIDRNGFDNVAVIECAIGSSHGSMDFYQHRFPGKSGLTKRGDLTYEKEYEVEVQTIPDILESNHISHVDFIKMDIEGQETAAIKSLGHRIKDIQSMVVELHFHQKDLKDMSGLYETLSSYGTLTDLTRGTSIDELHDLDSGVKREFIFWQQT